MPCARGAEDDTSVIPTQVLQLHRHPVRWKDLHGLVRPLYGADPFDIDELIDAEVTDLRYRVQSIQIEVMEGEAALITRRQDVGGAMDVVLDTQARRQALGKTGFAGPKAPDDQEQLATLAGLAQRPGQALSLRRSMGGPHDLLFHGPTIIAESMGGNFRGGDLPLWALCYTYYSMKVAILSDIHSNIGALSAVLEDAETQGVRDAWCLGDTVGYGPSPRECINVVRQLSSHCIAGNHDLGASGAISLDDFNVHAADANRWTAKVLSPENKTYLSGLPSMLTAEGVTLAHGSPREPVWEYVLSSLIATTAFYHFETPLCFVGHSHIPFVCYEPKDGALAKLEQPDTHGGVPLEGRRAIINPGSVGQPRDDDPRASYAIFDVSTTTLYHRRVEYDVAETQDRMRKAGLPEPLIQRLAYGR